MEATPSHHGFQCEFRIHDLILDDLGHVNPIEIIMKNRMKNHNQFHWKDGKSP